MSNPKYARIKCVVYVKMKVGESLDEAEDRLIGALPEGMDVANMKSSFWDDDSDGEEE